MAGSQPNAGGRPEVPDIDTSVAHPARVYDYMLGGEDHFAVDREAAEHAFGAYVGGIDVARVDARSNRALLGRIVRYLALEAGIRQFLDIGTGIPTADNVHQVAQRADPATRIVYVDNDPVVLAHAHTLLTSTSEGATAYLHADLREPETVLEQAAATLDFDAPVVVMLVAILHLLRDEDDPYGLVSRLLEPVASGSYLVVSHATNDIEAEDMTETARRLTETMREPFVLRNRAEIARFFDGLDLVEPGVVQVDRWRPDQGSGPTTTAPTSGRVTPIYAAVGRKP